MIGEKTAGTAIYTAASHTGLGLLIWPNAIKKKKSVVVHTVRLLVFEGGRTIQYTFVQQQQKDDILHARLESHTPRVAFFGVRVRFVLF